MKILIIGLPGSGKTTLAKKIVKLLRAKWLNADKIRKEYDDWDFSKKGIIRQSKRMGMLSKKYKKHKYIVADFICPFNEGRKLFNSDVLIWMDTIKIGRFKKDSIDHFFQQPKKYDFRIKRRNSELWSKKIALHIKTEYLETKSISTNKLK